ncbi:hypothetical protein DFJ43DRAFT_563489 [Lentinula guzmanii]|uniref:Uncharacterized protein n=1 Tax=Lentinula guzmanii TaxID=2804957 RepID=A0AA38JIN6_9AGAR|nr:hypothetical protein DFJ43DRAFT_563489 [Lentinula guzmanii]
MHRTRQAVPFICRQCSQKYRLASTATKLQSGSEVSADANKWRLQKPVPQTNTSRDTGAASYSSSPVSNASSSPTSQGESSSAAGLPLRARSWSRIIPAASSPTNSVPTPAPASPNSTNKAAPAFRQQVMLDREEAPHTRPPPLSNTRAQNAKFPDRNHLLGQDNPNSRNGTSTHHLTNRNSSLISSVHPSTQTVPSTPASSNLDLWDVVL